MGKGSGSIDTGNAFRKGRIGAQKIKPLFGFDPDHRGTQIGQVFGALGSGNDPGKIQDFKALQGRSPVRERRERWSLWFFRHFPGTSSLLTENLLVMLTDCRRFFQAVVHSLNDKWRARMWNRPAQRGIGHLLPKSPGL